MKPSANGIAGMNDKTLRERQIFAESKQHLFVIAARFSSVSVREKAVLKALVSGAAGLPRTLFAPKIN